MSKMSNLHTLSRALGVCVKFSSFISFFSFLLLGGMLHEHVHTVRHLLVHIRFTADSSVFMCACHVHAQRCCMIMCAGTSFTSAHQKSSVLWACAQCQVLFRWRCSISFRQIWRCACDAKSVMDHWQIELLHENVQTWSQTIDYLSHIKTGVLRLRADANIITCAVSINKIIVPDSDFQYI